MLQPPADDAGEEEWASTMSMSEDVLLSTWCEMDFLTYPQLLLCECVNSTWRRKVRSALHSLRCLNLTCGSATLDESLLSIRQGQSAWQATPPPLLRPMWTLAEEGRLRIVEDAFGKLGICENLQALDLRSMGALSRKVSQGLALVLLARPVLQRLNLDSNFLGDEGATALAQALRLSGAPCLRSLSLSQNNLGAVACAELAPALSSAGKALRSERWGLQELIISSNNIGDRGLRHLLVLTALHSLDVRSNGYTVQGCRMLWMLVNGLDVSRVSKLFLGRCLGWPNRIGDGGFVYIALALASLGHLRHLDLTRIGLSMQGCWLLSRVLCQLQHLSTAALGGVLAPTTAGGVLAPTTDPTTALPALSASLHKQHRAALFSSRLAQDRDEQQQQAQQREDHHRQEPAADVFGGLPWALGSREHLIHLDLSLNALSDVGFTALAAGLSSAPRLRSLDLSCNKAGDEGCIALRAVIAPAGIPLPNPSPHPIQAAAAAAAEEEKEAGGGKRGKREERGSGGGGGGCGGLGGEHQEASTQASVCNEQRRAEGSGEGERVRGLTSLRSLVLADNHIGDLGPVSGV